MGWSSKPSLNIHHPPEIAGVPYEQGQGLASPLVSLNKAGNWTFKFSGRGVGWPAQTAGALAIQTLPSWRRSVGPGMGELVLGMRYSSAGYGVFHCQKRVSEGYGVFHCWIRSIPLLLIGSDIEYIKLEDIHSYLDEIFPKCNTP